MVDYASGISKRNKRQESLKPEMGVHGSADFFASPVGIPESVQLTYVET
jgi:hypothetical protein